MADEKGKSKMEEQEKVFERKPEKKEEKKTQKNQTQEDEIEKRKKPEKEEESKSKKPEGEKKTQEKTEKGKKENKKKDGKKKNSARINLSNIPISTKHSKAICRFIINKKVKDAISDLEQVVIGKKSVPMKGEIPHRKGKGMMSGRFPEKASKNFLRILKSLSANAIYNGIEDPVIIEAVANIGERPYGKFGRVRMKRTHINIAAKSQEKLKNKE